MDLRNSSRKNDENRLENQRENPPLEWVILRKREGDSFSQGEYAKAFCSYIDRFYWRSRNGKSDQLHVVMHNSNGDNSRYLYKGVPRSVYDEMWNRAYFPEDFSREFGSWFAQSIKGEYEYKNYK